MIFSISLVKRWHLVFLVVLVLFGLQVATAEVASAVADATVAKGPIVITSPAKSDTWQVGQTKTITWSGHNNLPVKIYLQLNVCNPDNTVCAPAQVLITQGVTGTSYAWTVPETLGGYTLNGSNYYIVLETSAPGVDYILWGQSGVFNIASSGVSTSPLFVSSPAGGVVVKSGSTTNVIWNVLADTQGLPVTVSYISVPSCTNCQFESTITPITFLAPNTGTYAWAVPASLSGQYKVRVKVGDWLDDSGVFTISSTPVSSGSIVITSPASGAVWQTGQTKAIAWSGHNNLPVTIKLIQERCPAGQSCVDTALRKYDIATGATGSPYNWTIPASVLAGSYRVSMETSSAGVDYILWGNSAVFSIQQTVQPQPITVTVNKPQVGETWNVGETKIITWSTTNPAGSTTSSATVKIELDANTVCSNNPCPLLYLQPYTIALTAPNNGSYSWTIPAELASRYQGQQQIVVTLSTGEQGKSGVFTIGKPNVVAPLVVDVPNSLFGTVGQYLAINLSASGGKSPYKFELGVDSKLPSGVTLGVYMLGCPVSQNNCASNSAIYTLSGTPTESGIFPLHIIVADNVANIVKKTVTLRVDSGSAAQLFTSGQLVRGNGGDYTVYYITRGNLKYAFSSLNDFTSKGLKLRDVTIVDQASLDAVGVTQTFARASGVSFKYQNSNTVYYLNPSNCKEGALGLASLRSWGISFADVHNIATDEQYPDCENPFIRFKENTVVRLSGDQTVYRYSAGRLHPFGSLQAFTRAGFALSNILTINQAEKDSYPVGSIIN